GLERTFPRDDEGMDAPGQSELPCHLLARREGQDRHVRTVLGYETRRRTGAGNAHDRLHSEILGGIGRGQGDRLCDGLSYPGPQVREVRRVVRYLFRTAGDAVHYPNNARRMDADRRLTRKHDRIGTLEYRVADVRHLGPCRPWAAHHGIEHLGSRNDDLSLAVALGNYLLLDDRHVFRRHLTAEVAAGYDDTVRRIDNLVDVGHAFGIFNLGDDGLVSTEVRDELFHRIYMLRPADKRGRDEIDPLFDGKADVLFVGVG